MQGLLLPAVAVAFEVFRLRRDSSQRCNQTGRERGDAGGGRVASATEFNKHFATRKSQVAHCRDNNKNNKKQRDINERAAAKPSCFFSPLSHSPSPSSSSSLLFLFAFCIVIAISKADEEGRREESYGPKWQIKCYQEADTWHIVARITQS